MSRIAVFLLVLPFFALPTHSEEAVVARVNKVNITARELETAVDRLIPRSTYHGAITEERRSEFREQALQELITTELQYQDARSRGIKPDKKQVQEQMDQIRAKFNSKKEWRAALEQAGMSEDQLRTQIEKGFLVRSVIEKTVAEPAKVSDAELREYYDKNTDKFKQPESMRLRIITASEESKAKDAFDRIKRGEDFGTVAGTLSEDNFRIMGGDIGYVHRGRIYPGLENAALLMKAGEIRGPIKTEGKWFVIKLEDRKPEYQLSFAESRDKLKKELEKKRMDELMDKWNNDLRTKGMVEVLIKK